MFCSYYQIINGVPRCNGTKEIEVCDCAGMKENCSFHTNVRDSAKHEKEKLCSAIAWNNIEESAPPAGMRIIGRERYCEAIHSLRFYEGKNLWYFAYDDPVFDYPAAIQPYWWIPYPDQERG